MNLKDHLALEVGEKVPRVTVNQDGGKVSYEALQAMTARDLRTCNVRIFDTPLTFDERRTSWGERSLRIRYNQDETAVGFLERVYGLCEDMLINAYT
ncbi:MAG: hypothetical protein KKD18_01765 [Nanoarchaeota archaeon]|nr:hypothetical protein [Nanoarchaeota archaeon]MBU0977121.1 hypothetical protein [Nanoarchaeota archaeon]